MPRWAWEIAILVVVSVAIAGGLYAVNQHAENQREEAEAAKQLTDEAAAAAISHQRVYAQRKGCRRANEGIRRVLYGFLKSAENARRREARHTKGVQRAGNLLAAREYREQQLRMERAARPFATGPHSPIVDCRRAYQFSATPFEGG